MQTSSISFVAHGKGYLFPLLFRCVHVIIKSQLELKMPGKIPYSIYFHFKFSPSTAKGNCKEG